MTITEAIRERRSVRTFKSAPLTEEEEAHLRETASHASDPFGGAVTISLISMQEAADFRPSTYGMIRGAMQYFTIAAGADDKSQLSAGYRFEQVVLEAWRMGLGTCWLGGTFRSSRFAAIVPVHAGQRLCYVSPVGAAASPNLMERISRKVAGSDHRKPFSELFSLDAADAPLPADNLFAPGLEMLRLAPSSTNSQPWRAIVCGSAVHFYYVPKSRFAMVDMGIALCHFHLAEQAAGRKGSFAPMTAGIPAPPAACRYLTTYRL